MNEPPKKIKALVVGADSGIGSALMTQLNQLKVPTLGTTRRIKNIDGNKIKLDLTQPPHTWVIPDKIEIAFICAAISKNELCLRDPRGTRLVNVTNTLALINTLASRGTLPVFLSTNLVFDGTMPFTPHNTPLTPKTEYGQQKADVEYEMKSLKGTIVRLTKVITPGHSILDSWSREFLLEKMIEPFSDKVLAPISLSFVVKSLIQIGLGHHQGIFHLSSDRDVTYSQLARRLALSLSVPDNLIHPISCLKNHSNNKDVPLYSTLLMDKESTELHILAPPADSAIEEYLTHFKQE